MPTYCILVTGGGHKKSVKFQNKRKPIAKRSGNNILDNLTADNNNKKKYFE